ncbi:gliding motility-associated C-terminal domain-containing protein [uncultured Fluviicola sp.]|uniref:T9SS type B sorting domain-containing protein n=1 Tax=uncultured Fluviicola sp. TaxID=463303 RepID=UPI0025E4557A|nr:gliding motility-associated C-terminal domain-containing protein [uncultured Fluviicola sp.]
MIKRSVKLLLIILSSLDARSQNTLILEASKDTYINTVIADQYQGQVQSLVAAGWTYGGVYGQGRSLLGFELCPLPDNFVLVSATLYLYHDYSASHAGHTTNGLNSAKLYQITSYWDESTTWSSQPSYDAASFSNIPGSTSSTQNYVIDVTGVVSNEISSSNEVDFYFALDEEITYRSLVFASKDHPDASVRPKLELVYYTDTTWCDNPPSIPDTTDSTIHVTDCMDNFTIPNIFTPNGDLVNDYLELNSECQPSSFHIDILNRWGNLVFESDDYGFTWNGKNKNTDADLSEGVYFYRIIVFDEQSEIVKNGFITLLR